MIAFQLRINGGEPIVAGADDLLLLEASIRMVGRLGAETHDIRPTDSICYLGGVTRRKLDGQFGDEVVHWCNEGGLKVGDVISIEITEAEPNQVSPIAFRRPFPDRPEDSSGVPNDR